MKYIKKAWNIVDNYVIARWQNRPSPALFWYLPEPPNITSKSSLDAYLNTDKSPLYLLDYREKLKYKLTNHDGIIVLPYNDVIGQQINPEAAFQYALGLHDQYLRTKDDRYLNQFFHYVNYFKQQQSTDGLWPYQFDWFGSKAPWYSALAQGRGAVMMLRAWLLTGNEAYKVSAKQALAKFNQPIAEGGFLHHFQGYPYYEEYPHTPTGVINGFMASLMNLWEVQHWFGDRWLVDLWQVGIASLEKMLPYYSTGWWSLYDLDANTPIVNVNSPRYHLLEIHYLQILHLLSNSNVIQTELNLRLLQYRRFTSRQRALSMKFMRKVLYK